MDNIEKYVPVGYVPRVRPTPEPEIVSQTMESTPGYHVTPIKKGVFGEASKIIEEASEFNDAVEQGVAVLALVELSDLYGAISGYLRQHHPGVTMDDLRRMSEVTERAFVNGRR